MNEGGGRGISLVVHVAYHYFAKIHHSVTWCMLQKAVCRGKGNDFFKTGIGFELLAAGTHALSGVGAVTSARNCDDPLSDGTRVTYQRNFFR